MPLNFKRAHKASHSPGAILSVLLLALLTYLLGWSSLFSLKQVVIHGTTQVPLIQKSLEQTSPKITMGEPLARVDVKAIGRSIASNEWISAAEVGRSWLHGSLTIYVVERVPVAAFTNSQGVIYYFDSRGNDFRSPISYPKIPSIQLSHEDRASKVAISSILQFLPQNIFARVENFSVKSAEDIEMTVVKSSKATFVVKWGSATDLTLKLGILNKIENLKENSHATVFDLSDPLSPIAK